MRTRGFELITDENKKECGEGLYQPKLPTRATKKAMAYDFYSPSRFVLLPDEKALIWTGVKAYMQDNEGLLINIRSSMGGMLELVNTQGWIDADYYNNNKNEGNIGIFLKNVSPHPIVINRHDRIAQGMFITTLVADNGNTEKERTGGFGSSGK